MLIVRSCVGDEYDKVLHSSLWSTAQEVRATRSSLILSRFPPAGISPSLPFCCSIREGTLPPGPSSRCRPGT